MGSTSVRIKNFEKYKGRKDVTHNSWFRCSNRLLEDPDFFSFTHEEMLVWIYIMSVASQKNTADITVHHRHAQSVARLSSPSIDSAIKKLKKLGVLQILPSRTVRGRYAADTSTCATRQTEHNTTEQDITGHAELRDADAHSAPASFSDPLISKYLEPIKNEVQFLWVQTYGDEAWVLSELKKAVLWSKANPTRAPKSNYMRFFTNWLARGWETHRKTLPSKQAGYGGKIEDILGKEAVP